MPENEKPDPVKKPMDDWFVGNEDVIPAQKPVTPPPLPSGPAPVPNGKLPGKSPLVTVLLALTLIGAGGYYLYTLRSSPAKMEEITIEMPKLPQETAPVTIAPARRAGSDGNAETEAECGPARQTSSQATRREKSGRARPAARSERGAVPTTQGRSSADPVVRHHALVGKGGEEWNHRDRQRKVRNRRGERGRAARRARQRQRGAQRIHDRRTALSGHRLETYDHSQPEKGAYRSHRKVEQALDRSLTVTALKESQSLVSLANL
jgi:hypothetical protein